MRPVSIAATAVSALAMLLLALPVRAADSSDWHRLVGILQYLEADYPAAVESKSEFELKEQHAFLEEALSVASELGPEAAPIAGRLRSLEPSIAQGRDGEAVSSVCGELVRDAVRIAKLDRSPTKTPDLQRGAEVYRVACAACHAADGSGRVSIAETMNPKPTNFLDPEVMEGLTPYKAYNTTTFGVPGTPMPAYPSLSDDDRWAVAYLLFTFRQAACVSRTDSVPLSLETLSNSTDTELARDHGAAALPCLRRPLPKTSAGGGGLARAESGVRDALARAAKGDGAGARRALIDAYLEGLEPEEPRLRGRNPALVRSLEEKFLALRPALEGSTDERTMLGNALLGLLAQAQEGESTPQQFGSVFGLSVLIVLREGFEAMVVIAALLAVLKKMGEERSARVVHGGWLSAIAVSVVIYLLGRKAIAGANRELVEGLVGLLAAGMLLYAALWLNARANIRRFMGELREKMQGALGRQSQVGLFAIAFASMFRETLETALFLEGLALDSPSGAAWGAVCGAAVLTALVFLIRRVGYRLPMKTLFSASTALLVTTAVVMLGKGIHALQEVGWIPLKHVPMFELELLGIFPDAVTLAAQITVVLAAWSVQRLGSPKPSGLADVKG